MMTTLYQTPHYGGNTDLMSLKRLPCTVQEQREIMAIDEFLVSLYCLFVCICLFVCPAGRT